MINIEFKAMVTGVAQTTGDRRSAPHCLITAVGLGQSPLLDDSPYRGPVIQCLLSHDDLRQLLGDDFNQGRPVYLKINITRDTDK